MNRILILFKISRHYNNTFVLYSFRDCPHRVTTRCGQLFIFIAASVPRYFIVSLLLMTDAE